MPEEDLAVDAEGNLVEGHLTIASFEWWTEQFDAAGFTRCPDVERRLYADIRPAGLAPYWNIYVFECRRCARAADRARGPDRTLVQLGLEPPAVRAMTEAADSPGYSSLRGLRAPPVRPARATGSSWSPSTGPRSSMRPTNACIGSSPKSGRVVDGDDSVAGVGDHRCGAGVLRGGDLAMVERMTTDHGTVVEQWDDANAVVEEMLASVKPIVSAVNGVAVGAGLAVALLADVSIVAESARCRTATPGWAWRPATMPP